MGWWSTNRGGYSFAEEEGEEMVWGDGPADLLDNAIDEIDKEFIETWGRPATTHELVAGMRFCYPYIQFGPDKGKERPGVDSREPVTTIDEAEYWDALRDPAWAAFCRSADEYIRSVDEPQPAVVDHGDLLEVCQAAEAWAGRLRQGAVEDREKYGALPLAEGSIEDYTEAADRIDKAIASARRTAYAAR